MKKILTWLGAALALGPFVPALLHSGARPVLWMAAALVAACCVIALAIPRHATTEPPPQAGFAKQTTKSQLKGRSNRAAFCFD